MARVVIKVLAAVALSFAVSASAEGADYIIETCDAVLGNKQDLLPIPFEFSEDRDVGYVGQHNILDNSSVEMRRGSLGTIRDIAGVEPGIVIASPYIKDSDQPPSPPSSYRMGLSAGGFDFEHLNGVVSPTAELTVYGWQRSKWDGGTLTEDGMKGFLEFFVKRSRGRRIVLVHSGGDVLYGGCDENTMLEKYNQIIASSPGTPTIVVGGEVSPYPSDLGWDYNAGSLDASRLAMLSAFGLAPGWAAAYANCTGALNSICDSTPKYQYANSGFVMGPAEDIYDMYAGLATYTGLENRMVNEYVLANPGVVTIDYAGILSLSLHNMVKSTGLPVEIGNGQAGKQLINKATGKCVCFVQGNGNSFGALKTLAADFKAQQTAAMR